MNRGCRQKKTMKTKNNFLPYEHSKMMKELGFDENTNRYYREGNNKNIYNHAGDYKWNTSSHYEKKKKIFPNIAIPLYQQAEEWLWEKHKIHIGVWREGTYYHFRIERAVTKTRLAFSVNSLENPIIAHIEGILKAIEYLHSQLKK